MTDKVKDNADLIVENQMLNNQVMVLSELALGAIKVLDYYSHSNLPCPIFSLVSSGETQSAFNSKTKYKVVEVLNTEGKDKELLVGMEMYDVIFDTNTALLAKNQIQDKLNELGITLIEEENNE